MQRIKNLSNNIEPVNITIDIETDVITQVIRETNVATNNFLGIGIIIPLWIGYYSTVSKPENNFNITKLQSVISVTTIIFTVALIFMYLQILTSSQHFIWISILLLVTFIGGIIRSS